MFEKDKYGDITGVTKKGKKIIILIVAGIFLFITFLSSFTTVKSGQVGLKVRFGKIVDNSISEGINFKIP